MIKMECQAFFVCLNFLVFFYIAYFFKAVIIKNERQKKFRKDAYQNLISLLCLGNWVEYRQKA